MEHESFSDVVLRPTDERTNPTSSISVNVSSPEKYSTFTETYTRYNVSCQSSREEFMNQSYSVFRRYNDFLWLRNRLEDTNPTLVIPPFPPKHSLHSVDRFSGPFIMERCGLLHTFLIRVCAHPVLSASDDLFHFLTIADDREWLNYKRVHNANGFALTEKMKSIVQSGQTSAEFADYIPKLDLCRDACETIIAASRYIADEERVLTKELTNMASCINRWSSETGHMPQLGNVLYHLGQMAEIRAQDLIPTSNCLLSKLVPSFTDLINYSLCVRRVAVRRNKLQGAIRDTTESATNLERALDTPSNLSRKIRGESITEERHRRESQISQLRTRSNSLTNCLDSADSDLRSEYAHWTRHRKDATRMALIDFAGIRLAHHRRIDDHWQSVMEKLTAAGLRNSDE